MRFLLKAAFWLGAVFLFMPKLTGENPKPLIADKSSAVKSQASPVGSFFDSNIIEKWQGTGKSLQDIQRLCEENPTICEAGKALLLKDNAQTSIRQKAKNIGGPNPGNIADPEQEPVLKVPLPLAAPR